MDSVSQSSQVFASMSWFGTCAWSHQVATWTENTPRALQKQVGSHRDELESRAALICFFKSNVSEVREPGTMLLRVCRLSPKKLAFCLSLVPGTAASSSSSDTWQVPTLGAVTSS